MFHFEFLIYTAASLLYLQSLGYARYKLISLNIERCCWLAVFLFPTTGRTIYSTGTHAKSIARLDLCVSSKFIFVSSKFIYIQGVKISFDIYLLRKE